MTKTTIKSLFSKFKFNNVKLKIPCLEAEIEFQDEDRKAAWELYIELLTRIATQPLPDNDGIEKSALDSVFSIFSITREILKKYGSRAINFSKIAIPVLNQIIRPFTAKWHKLASEDDFFSNPAKCKEFRKELKLLQQDLRKYNRLLAEIADVEDLTGIEE